MTNAIEGSRAGRLVIFEMLAGFYDYLDIVIHDPMNDAVHSRSPDAFRKGGLFVL